MQKEVVVQHLYLGRNAPSEMRVLPQCTDVGKVSYITGMHVKAKVPINTGLLFP